MSATTHTIEAEWEDEAGSSAVTITFTFLKGAPEQGPSYSSGGQPADPDEVDFVSAKLANSMAPYAYQTALDEWARGWLQDEGFNAACDVAFEDNARGRDDY